MTGVMGQPLFLVEFGDVDGIIDTSEVTSTDILVAVGVVGHDRRGRDDRSRDSPVPGPALTQARFNSPA